MGIFDRAIERIAKEIVKASPTATPITDAQLQAAQNLGYGNSAGLTRDPNMGNVPFTPGVPIIPGAINPLRADGRPDPRRYEYQVAQNINITETRLVPFKTLRAAADQIDILRRCIEVLKAKMQGLDWDVVLAEDAAEQVMQETGETNFTKAMAKAKEQFQDEINRLKQFWEVPDIANGLIFSDWLNMALEDVLVLDALAIWPQKQVGGDLNGLQILDGATIKPLIDDRGMRPAPPYPAFQQILYGFPRSEFSAPDETLEADGEFSSDELAYMIRNRRTTTIYGYSPTERALPLADLYLRRQQWLRAEYTDGVLPELLFETDANFGNSPDLLRAYENVFNDDLAGQTEQRKRARLLPAGVRPVQMDGYGEKFKDTLDEFLITSICGHFGVMPTEIGYTPKTGLGGAGHQNGEASSSEVIGLIPLQQWMGRMISQLSYVFLGMPRELEFRFMPSDRADAESDARASDLKLRGGRLTINEARSAEGLPLIDNPSADQPIFVTSAGTFMLTDEGFQNIAGDLNPSLAGSGAGAPPEGSPAPSPASATISENAPAENPATSQPGSPDESDDGATDKSLDVSRETLIEQMKETKAFLRWLRKSPARPFDFKVMPVVFADTLNTLVAQQDFDGARFYAEQYLA
jgi:hypothetical protein